MSRACYGNVKIFTVPPEELDQVRAEQTYIGGELVHPGQ